MAIDLTQLVTDENPYGYMDADADVSTGVNDIKGELDALRAGTKVSGPLNFVGGPAARYTKQNPAPPADTYDKLMKGLFWFFNGEQVRISKAMRLQYRVGGQSYNILIGFEGSSDGM